MEYNYLISIAAYPYFYKQCVIEFLDFCTVTKLRSLIKLFAL